MDNLPGELLLRVFKKLPADDRACCSFVCRRWRAFLPLRSISCTPARYMRSIEMLSVFFKESDQAWISDVPIAERLNISGKYFESVCLNGNLRVAEWMCNTNRLTEPGPAFFDLLCRAGNIEILKLCCDVFNLRPTRRDIKTVCELCTVDVYKYIADRYNCPVDSTSLTMAARNDSPATIEHMLKTAEFPAATQVNCCAVASVPVVEFLHQKNHLTIQPNRVFEVALDFGNFDICGWVYSRDPTACEGIEGVV